MKKLPLASLFAALVLLASPLLRAQEPAPATKPVPPSMISIDFPGGSLAQLVTMLAKTPGGPVNVIGDPADLATPLPAFSLQNVHPDLVARSLNNFLYARGVTLAPSGIGITGSRDIYTVARTDKRPRPTVPPPDAFESIQLAPFLDQQKIDDIVGAIRVAWEIDPTHEAAALRLKFHPPTQILIVSGPPEATLIATKIVSTMKRTPHEFDAVSRGKPEPSPKPEKR